MFASLFLTVRHRQATENRLLQAITGFPVQILL